MPHDSGISSDQPSAVVLNIRRFWYVFVVRLQPGNIILQVGIEVVVSKNERYSRYTDLNFQKRKTVSYSSSPPSNCSIQRHDQYECESCPCDMYRMFVEGSRTHPRLRHGHQVGPALYNYNYTTTTTIQLYNCIIQERILSTGHSSQVCHLLASGAMHN